MSIEITGESMPKPKRSNPTNTYVVRVWREWSIKESLWRGSIEHLESKQRTGFKDFDKMLAFLQSTCNFIELEETVEEKNKEK